MVISNHNSLSDEARFKVAVIGCGVQGRIHLAAYQAIPGVEIVAVCDQDPTRLEAARRDFNVPASYSGYRDCLEEVSIDLLSVCTMPVSHHAIVVAGLNRGANVLCEKPMAMNATEAESMVEAARRNRRVLTIGYNMRWMGSAQFARRYVSEGRLGTPQFARVTALANDIPWWGRHYVRSISSGGVLASTAVHVLDLTLWVMGGPTPIAASATKLRRFPERRGTTAPDRDAHQSYDVEDFLTAHIRLADGIALNLESAWAFDALDSRYSFDLTGSLGRLQFDPLQVIHEQNGKPIDVTPVNSADVDWSASVHREICDVVQAIRQGQAPTVTAEEGLTIQRLCDALYRSATEGREIQL